MNYLLSHNDQLVTKSYDFIFKCFHISILSNFFKWLYNISLSGSNMTYPWFASYFSQLKKKPEINLLIYKKKKKSLFIVRIKSLFIWWKAIIHLIALDTNYKNTLQKECPKSQCMRQSFCFISHLLPLGIILKLFFFAIWEKYKHFFQVLSPTNKHKIKLHL